MILAAKIALVCAGTVVAGTTVLCSEGFIRVNVSKGGARPQHIDVIAPAMLVPIAVHVASRFAPREKIAEASENIQPWMPTIHAALGELYNLDDMTLVEVSKPGDYVRVQKIGSSIVVDVEGRDRSVHISAPIRAISNTVQQIANAADAADSAGAADSSGSQPR